MSQMTDEQVKEYWRRNVSLMVKAAGSVVCRQLWLRHHPG